MAVRKTVDITSEEYILGQNILRIRKQRGLSQTQLANLMDMDRAAISRYESGTNGEMGFTTLRRFAKALSVTTSVLLDETTEEENVLENLTEENRNMILKMAAALKLQQQITA